MTVEFKNEAFVDFSKEENQTIMNGALAKVEGEFGKEYPGIIDGQKITTGNWLSSVNPSYKDQIVGKVAKLGKENVEQAMESAGMLLKYGRTKQLRQELNIWLKLRNI